MKKFILAFLAFTFSVFIGYSQDGTQQFNNKNDDPFKIIFENGFLIGNPDNQYPMPFSSHLSFVIPVKNLLLGLGSGAEVIGRTYIPVFADIRYMPFKSKPIYIYGKGGYNLCLTNEYKEEYNIYYAFSSYWPIPSPIEYKCYGGILAEAGFGFILKMKNWDTSINIGYRFQKTKYITDETTNKHTYENYYNRVALRLGFWF